MGNATSRSPIARTSQVSLASQNGPIEAIIRSRSFTPTSGARRPHAEVEPVEDDVDEDRDAHEAGGEGERQPDLWVAEERQHVPVTPLRARWPPGRGGVSGVGKRFAGGGPAREVHEHGDHRPASARRRTAR